MADVFDAATRSRIMRAIRSRDTKPELALADALVAYGIRYRRDGMRLPGRPDFVLLRSDLVVFVHGCFWHLCPRHYKPPSGAAWREKMDRNRRRDVRVRRQLRRLGWRTMVVWSTRIRRGRWRE
jgi:DNA mismatch endonuclease (patch repair protein)